MLSRTQPLRTLTDMAIIKNQRNNRLRRTCPVCGRRQALVLNPVHGFRFCRWAADGLCSFSEAVALDEYLEEIRG